MSSELWEAKFVIANLFMPNLELQEEKMWLEENEVLLRRYNNDVIVFVKVEDHNKFEAENKIVSYLRLCSLLTTYAPKIDGGTFHLLESNNDFGKDTTILSVQSLGRRYTEEQKNKIKPHFTNFLKKSYALHKKYSQLYSICPFLELANEYFYRSRLNRGYESESFIDAAISLEALYNEEPSDIRYKIAMRSAYVLGCIGYDSSEIFRNVTELYNIRNNIVHGKGKAIEFDKISKIWLMQDNLYNVCLLYVLLITPT
jgi:hypothetical protein